MFGNWDKSNYNTVIETFWYNVPRSIEIQIGDRNRKLTLSHIDDVISEIYNATLCNANIVAGFCKAPVVYTKTLGEIVDFILKFKETKNSLNAINTEDGFGEKLYSTHLSCLSERRHIQLRAILIIVADLLRLLKQKARVNFS